MKKITMQIADLLPVLRRIKDIKAENTLMPILSNILLRIKDNQLQIVANDLMIALIAEVPITNGYEKDYEYLMPFKYFFDICTKINEAGFTLEFISTTKKEKGKPVTTTAAKITTLADKYEIALEDTTDWPQLPEFPKENSIGIGDTFIECMNAAVDTLYKDSDLSAAQKVLIRVEPNLVTIVSTNKNVLYEKWFPVETSLSADLLVSRKIAKGLEGLKETSISWSDSHVTFISSNITLIGTLQDEKYPNYKAIIPDYERNLTVSHVDLKAVMGKMMINSSTSADGKVQAPNVTIYLKKEIGFIVFETFDAEYGRGINSRLPVDYTGTCEKVTINPKQMLRLLGQVKYVTLSLAIMGSNKGIVIETESDSTYRSLIMPMAAPSSK